MAKGAAKEKTLGALHAKVADVFLRVLETYEKRIMALEQINPEDITDDVLAELFNEGYMPDPKMLNAVTAFLKNNEIRFDDEQVQGLSALQQSLEERRKNRPNIVSLTTLKAVCDE